MKHIIFLIFLIALSTIYPDQSAAAGRYLKGEVVILDAQTRPDEPSDRPAVGVEISIEGADSK